MDNFILRHYFLSYFRLRQVIYNANLMTITVATKTPVFTNRFAKVQNFYKKYSVVTKTHRCFCCTFAADKVKL